MGTCGRVLRLVKYDLSSISWLAVQIDMIILWRVWNNWRKENIEIKIGDLLSDETIATAESVNEELICAVCVYVGVSFMNEKDAHVPEANLSNSLKSSKNCVNIFVYQIKLISPHPHDNEPRRELHNFSKLSFTRKSATKWKFYDFAVTPRYVNRDWHSTSSDCPPLTAWSAF